MPSRASLSRSRWRVAAALSVCAAGLALLSHGRTPVLTAASEAPKAGSLGGSDLRDAVASPGMVPGAGGWFQAAAGVAASGRAAPSLTLMRRDMATLPPRATSGRKVFSGKRVIVDRVQPGVPEPGFGPIADSQTRILSARLQKLAAALSAKARQLSE
jgi:hypothetical protein